MKHLTSLVVFCALTSINTMAQTYGLDNADPSLFSKFRIPETSLSSLWFNTSLSFSSQKSSTYGFGSDNLYNYFNSSLGPQYYLLNESDDRYLSVFAAADGSYSNSKSSSEGVPSSQYDFYRNWNDGLNASANETFRDYTMTDDFFYSLNSSAQFNLSEMYNDAATSDTTRYINYESARTQSYNLSFGVGWGKMRNVTSIVSAVRFQERLKQLNLLNDNLSEKSIEDLAGQFYRQGYYSNVHVRPDKYFWDDVEKVLSADGVSLSGLNQYADSYIREVPNELRFSRNEGMLGGINLQINYNNNSTTNFNNGLPTGEQLYTLGNVYINYSHQLNLNSQVSFGISVSGGPNVIKHPVVKQEYLASLNLGYDYELTDRIVVSMYNSFALTFQNMEAQGKNLSDDLDLDLNYFVEDNLSLDVSYSLNYSDSKNTFLYGSYRQHFTQSNNYVQLGFTYYIERGFIYK